MSEDTKIDPENVVSEDLDKQSKRGKKKDSNKKAVDPSTITPEYIEEQRRLRELRKEAKKKELEQGGDVSQQHPMSPKPSYISREFLPLPESVNNGTPTGFPLKIMSYNMLAQALIRRKLFPTSGDALKWAGRSEVLLKEISDYDPDIACLQEVDYIQFNSFWKPKFDTLGYESKFHRDPSKNHGVAVIFKKKLFVVKHQSFINFDTENSGDLTSRTITQNVGFLVYLEFMPFVKQRFPNLSRDGVVIGTSHLFWHPFGTFERSRQTYVILQKVKEFKHTLKSMSKSDTDFYTFFAADCNSQPFDAPYLSITAKPVSYEGRAETVLCCSLSYRFSENRGKPNTSSTGEDSRENSQSNTNKNSEYKREEERMQNQPRDPVPDSFSPTDDQLALAKKMQELHNNLDMRAISLYSVGYKYVDPANAGKDNDRGEPLFSNWAHAWRGLLDYIFVISEWDGISDHSKEVDSPKDLEKEQSIRLNKLLKLPLPEEMGPEPSGQPRLGQYPSDHLCLVAEVELI